MNREQAITFIENTRNLTLEGTNYLQAIINDIPTNQQLGLSRVNPMIQSAIKATIYSFIAVPIILSVHFIDNSIVSIIVMALLLGILISQGMESILQYNSVEILINEVKMETYNWDHVVAAAMEGKNNRFALLLVSIFIGGLLGYITTFIEYGSNISISLIYLYFLSTFSLGKTATFRVKYLLHMTTALKEFRKTFKKKNID